MDLQIPRHQSRGDCRGEGGGRECSSVSREGKSELQLKMGNMGQGGQGQIGLEGQTSGEEVKAEDQFGMVYWKLYSSFYMWGLERTVPFVAIYIVINIIVYFTFYFKKYIIIYKHIYIFLHSLNYNSYNFLSYKVFNRHRGIQRKRKITLRP